MEAGFVKDLVQITVVMVPALIAIVAYLDRKSETRQKLLQESVYLILEGVEKIGQLSRSNTCELQDMRSHSGDSCSSDTKKALDEYDNFVRDLSKFKNGVASRNL